MSLDLSVPSPRSPLSLLPDDDVSLSRLENLLQVPFLAYRAIICSLGKESCVLRSASRACRAAIRDTVSALSSDDQSEALAAASLIRRALSVERNPPIDKVINAGAVPPLIALLKLSSNPKLQYEAAWALSNIAAGTSAQARHVADHGAVPAFVHLLQSPDADVKEQGVWALGNMAGDMPEVRACGWRWEVRE